MTKDQEIRAWSLEIAATMRQTPTKDLNDLFPLADSIKEYIETEKLPAKRDPKAGWQP